MSGNKGLAKQCLTAAVAAAYVGALGGFFISSVWRYQTGADASMCPVGSGNLQHLCGIGELSLAFLFDFLWALYGLPFALVLTAPCALALGALAAPLEARLNGRALMIAQYGLAAVLGLVAGLALGVVIAGIFAACTGVWTFRRARYSGSLAQMPSADKPLPD